MVHVILCSDAKVSKRKSLFSSIRVFFFELVIFFLVLVLLKFHHSKFHACKQPRNFVNSLWIRCVTTASQTPLLKDVKTASFKCVTDNYVIYFPSKVMEEHILLLEALCWICGGNIRGNDRVKPEMTRLQTRWWSPCSVVGVFRVFVELSLAEMLRQQQSKACLYHGWDVF